MQFRKKILFADLESPSGTDATPETTATNAIQTRNLDISDPYGGNTIPLNLDTDYLGAEPLINVAPNARVTFEVLLAGSGTAGTAPPWSKLVRACAYDETVTPSTSVAYQPVSDSYETCTLSFIHDGQMHKLLYAMGNVVWDLMRGDVPRMIFSFLGLYVKPTTATHPTDYAAFQKPIPITKANTPTFDIGAYSAISEGLRIDTGMDLVHRNLINSESIRVRDREMLGRVTVEAPTIATHDFYGDVESHDGYTLQAIQLVHGTTAGNIFTFDAPKVQLSSINHEDSDGILAYGMDARFTPDSGDDELVITLT